MMGSSWKHGLVKSAATQPPLGLDEFFQGFSNIVFTFVSQRLTGAGGVRLGFGCD